MNKCSNSGLLKSQSIIKTGETETKTVILDGTTSLRDALESNDIVYDMATVYLDGCTINTGDLDKSFNELGIGERCSLMAIVNTKNA